MTKIITNPNMAASAGNSLLTRLNMNCIGLKCPVTEISREMVSLITKPEITKNISTPRKPPGTFRPE
jgi:hypothetical protein